MDTQRTGLLIAIEGIDGAGKSSICTQFAQKLASHFRVICTKEPGGTQFGNQLRTILQSKEKRCPRAEFLLFAADRAHHFTHKIIPLLQKKTLIISDRMADSSLVYQGYGRNLDRTIIQSVNQWAMQNYTPDYTVYIRTPLNIALQRINKRNEERTSFESEKYSFMQRLVNGFEELYANRSDVITIDGTLSIDIIANQLYDKLFNVLYDKLSL